MKFQLPGFVDRYFKKQEGLKKYQESISTFLADSELSVEENDKLAELQKEFGLSAEDVKGIHKTSVASVFTSIGSDKRITDEEKSSLEKLLTHFNISKEDIAFNQDSFNKYYTLALVDKGVLPTIDNAQAEVNIVFKEGEVLHWAVAADMMKRKKVTTKVNYGGFTGSVKIMKGVRYRVGSMNIGSVSKEILDREDSGIFYVTNQRLGYLGYRKQFSFPFKKIGSLELRPDGLHIFKDDKEAPYILEMTDYELALAVISFLLNKDE
jgi:hypothetical protein